MGKTIVIHNSLHDYSPLYSIHDFKIETHVVRLQMNIKSLEAIHLVELRDS